MLLNAADASRLRERERERERERYRANQRGVHHGPLLFAKRVVCIMGHIVFYELGSGVNSQKQHRDITSCEGREPSHAATLELGLLRDF